MRGFWMAALLAVGCAKERDPAPDDVDGLLHYTFRHWEDEEALHDAIEGLTEWLETDGRDTDARDGFRLTPLEPADMEGLVYPDRDLADALGVAAGSQSPFAIERYPADLVAADQTYLAPGSYTKYEREIVEGDVDTFLAGEGLVRALNDIEKENVGVRIPFLQHKDYRWVHLSDGRRAIVARSWTEEESCNEGGGNCILQGYAVDVMYASDDAETVRLTTTWTELKTALDGVLSEDAMVGVAINGIVAIHDNEVRHLEEADASP